MRYVLEKRRWRFMKAEEFDEKFDKNEDITEFLNLSETRRPGHEQKRVNVDFPLWIIEALDREASKLSVTRQSIIKVWLAEGKRNISKSQAKALAEFFHVPSELFV
jgi:hypothetical protein